MSADDDRALTAQAELIDVAARVRRERQPKATASPTIGECAA